MQMQQYNGVQLHTTNSEQSCCCQTYSPTIIKLGLYSFDKWHHQLFEQGPIDFNKIFLLWPFERSWGAFCLNGALYSLNILYNLNKDTLSITH